MDKALIDINYIQKQKDKYIEFLNTKLGSQILVFLEDLSQISEILIFSGVTRDFFLQKKSNDIRDLDLVVNCHDKLLYQFLKKFKHTRNSFGGYKIRVDNLYIDIWKLEETWALKNSKIQLSLFDSYSLPSTAFFNFSSIVYDYNNQMFIATSDFLRFLQTKKIDLVLEDNPLPELCIINSIYYKNKFNLELSNHLKEYIVNNFPKHSKEDYQSIQIKHFKSELYSYGVLEVYYQMIKSSMMNKQ